MRKAPAKQQKTQFARQKFQELPHCTSVFYVISVNKQHGMLAHPHWQDEQMAQRGLINTTATPQHRLTGHQKRYHDHQATIEHLQQDIARIRRQQDVIVARFMQEVLPLEHQYLRTVYAKTSRLLSFADKKSLGKRDKAALFIWLDTELDELFHHPFNDCLDLNTLRQQIDDLNTLMQGTPTPDDIHTFRQELTEVFGSDNDLSDDELIKMMADPERIFDTMAQPSDNTSETYDSDIFDDGGFFGDTENTSPEVSPSVLKSAEITRMYKKLASQLHPDREPDPTKKALRHELMVTLSKARQANDIWTIIDMFREHVDPDYFFSEAELPAINALLQRRIQDLQLQRMDITDPHSLPGMIWDKLGAKTEKAINNKFKKHTDVLLRMTTEQSQQYAALRSLKVLRQHLVPWRAELEQEEIFHFC